MTVADASRFRLPRRTARLRLTLLYSGLFLLLGTVVIVVIYALSSSGLVEQTSSVAIAKPGPGGGSAELVFPAKVAVSQHNHDLNGLLAASWVVLVLTALGSAVLGWFVAGRVLRPLRSITSTARSISAGSLNQRLALAGPDDEFKQLGDTLDDLFARLEASFDSQRRFVANASHELRTPLTVERTLLQVALADSNATVDTLRATCEELLASGIDQERLLESLLTLASSERGLEQREPLDLAVIADEVIAAARPELDRLGLVLDTTLSPAATTGDGALVERLTANLVENAAHYNVAGGRIAVRTGVTHDVGAALLVTNTGPVVAPEEVARLLEPFQRLESRTAEADGCHGLGLSIVRAIAGAHDATLDVRAPRSGGLVVTVTFPPAAPRPA